MTVGDCRSAKRRKREQPKEEVEYNEHSSGYASVVGLYESYLTSMVWTYCIIYRFTPGNPSNIAYAMMLCL